MTRGWPLEMSSEACLRPSSMSGLASHAVGFARADAGVDGLTEKHLTRNHAFDAVKTSNEARLGPSSMAGLAGHGVGLARADAGVDVLTEKDLTRHHAFDAVQDV